MLELAFEREDSRRRDLDALLDAGYALRCDQIQKALGGDEAKARKFIETKSNRIREYSIDGHDYYGRWHPDEEDYITSLDTLRMDLGSRTEELEKGLMQKEREIEMLDQLAMKWTEVAIDAFREIQQLHPHPLKLKKLVQEAGFDPDRFNIDYEEIDLSEPNSSTTSDGRSETEYDGF